MENILDQLQPKSVWAHFEDICQVPRPSKKEEKIIEFLLDFGKKHNLETKRDEIGNVLIKKPATPGKEDLKTVVLQSHMDMVCEKNNETEHNFDTDPIVPWIDNGWVKAKGTTLGADDGIGMAAEMALLTATDIEHGPIECLFTVDEETGLSGAFALQPGFFDGKILLNLDSEDEGEIFIGCAGGIDTIANMEYKKEEVPTGHFALRIDVKGLLGGHSGDEINKGRGNSNKILNRFLWQINKKYNIRLHDFNGGNLRNAIPREAFAIITIPSEFKENVRADLNIYAAEMEHVWEIYEPKLKITLESVETPEFVIDREISNNLFDAIYACPHGVFSMSSRMPGMVETSTNLASVKFVDGNKILITTSQRSDVDSEKYNIAQMVGSALTLAGANIEHTDGYPGWAPNPNSEILTVAVDSYKRLFDKEPVVRSIHAGLECGLFLEKYPDMDMISFGPTLRDVHSPDERINIETVEKFWLHLIDIIQNVPKN
ncbi:aminoacyl-histidine dipeptidase [Marinifilum caeruleilacunae]|uniref:Aminoacyl-histidine dipeptidase n=1 Tax=Marinifilum caeruleilacunae TaxID=2499076 RepID=A0ABX1X0V3_9BACT|nr:aminoacyl-histidine dipeptidase [Marinifilum caeruleilacunae]NOU61729.1 aminoacyl-histidine dipeptidase [Marinifilum caeruleilacunae]